MQAIRWIGAAALALLAVNGNADTSAQAIAEDCVAPPIVVSAIRAPQPALALSDRYAALVERASRAHGVDGALIHALIYAESSYDPNAVSPAGATGLMQLMPETARRYGEVDLFDPEQNVRVGVRHFRDLLSQFDGDLELALAAYNAGPAAVERAGRRIPPNAETTRYVPKVIAHYRRLQTRAR